MLRGSYYNGFAPRDGMPMYPSSWRGCVGAWAPCLGPSGVTLRDWSGYANHGTITNSTIASSWVTSAGRYAVSLDGTDDYIQTASSSSYAFGTGDLTVAAWIRTTDTDGGIVIQVASTGSQWGLVLFGSNMYWQSDTEVTNLYFRSATSVIDGKWHHIAVIRRGGSSSMYFDGVQQGASVADSTNYSTSQQIRMGSFAFGVLTGEMDDVRVYQRAISVNELSLLASRRGIAYELAPMRVPCSEQVATAARLRRLLLLGVGS